MNKYFKRIFDFLIVFAITKIKLNLKKIHGINVREYLFRTLDNNMQVIIWNNNINKR